jgi:hypothetical protein
MTTTTTTEAAPDAAAHPDTRTANGEEPIWRKSALVRALDERGACFAAVRWASSLPEGTTAQQAWDACPRADWLVWWLRDEDPRELVRATAEALRASGFPFAGVAATLLDAAEAWTRGGTKGAPDRLRALVAESWEEETTTGGPHRGRVSARHLVYACLAAEGEFPNTPGEVCGAALAALRQADDTEPAALVETVRRHFPSPAQAVDVAAVIAERGACFDARYWASSLPEGITAQQAWDACPRADWLVWWLRDADAHDLIAVACEVTRLYAEGAEGLGAEGLGAEAHALLREIEAWTRREASPRAVERQASLPWPTPPSIGRTAAQSAVRALSFAVNPSAPDTPPADYAASAVAYLVASPMVRVLEDDDETARRGAHSKAFVERSAALADHVRRRFPSPFSRRATEAT